MTTFSTARVSGERLTATRNPKDCDSSRERDSTRSRLAARQAALLRALVEEAPAPEGFASRKTREAALSLAWKRCRSVARAWPALSAALGEEMEEQFAQFAAKVPLPSRGGPLADGRRFAEWLARQQRLPAAGWTEAFLVDLHWKRVADGLAPRCGVYLLVRYLPGERCVWLGLRRRSGWWHTLKLTFPHRRRE